MCFIEDSRQVRDQINKEVLVDYHEGEGGHASFMVGRDMSYMDRVIKLVMRFNRVSEH